MLADLQKYKLDYSLLAILSGAYLVVVLKILTTPLYIILATAGYAFLYFLWGVLHHLASRTLYKKVVLEYFLVAVLAIVIVSTLLI